MATLRIRGARTHTLKEVDLDLPLDALVVLCGRSGTGKSSLAFDTLHAEGQRRYLEALSLKARQVIGALPRPDVDQITGLPPTIALVQHVGPLPPRASVGSFVEVEALLQVLFGRVGQQHCPVSGVVVRATPHDVIVARLLAHPEGTRLFLEAPVAGSSTQDRVEFAVRGGFSRVRVGGVVHRLDELPALPADLPVRVVVDRIRVGDERRERVHDAVRTAAQAGGGVVVAVVEQVDEVFTDRPISPTTGRVLPTLRPALFRPLGPDACSVCRGRGEQDGVACVTCGGTGLGDAALAVTYEGARWLDLVASPLSEVRARIAAWPEAAVATPLVDEITTRMDALLDVGLAHLRLVDALAGLSSGELQRLRLASQIGSDLSGVLFVLDEPTLGLGTDEVVRIVGLLRRLQARGNGVLVVDHHPELIRRADRVIEFGPGPGQRGGRVIFDGRPEDLIGADTPTGRWLAEGAALLAVPRKASAWIRLAGARSRNLQGMPVAFPRGAFTVVTGPSGAGKSALLEALGVAVQAQLDHGSSAGLEGAEGLQRLLVVDAIAARRSRRSMPATYIGFWDTMRELYAATQASRVRAFDAARFSLNVPGGRCESCEGLGVRRIELELLPPVDVPCDVCEGRRFAADVLEVRWKGLDAGALLGLAADEALPILAGHPRLEEALRALRDVGLGYLPLGQPTHTLSGGESRRLVLARELVRAHRRGAADALVLLDEPTAGLHPADVEALHDLIVRLTGDGATVVVASHSERLVAVADHVVTLGPGAGPAGGRVLDAPS